MKYLKRILHSPVFIRLLMDVLLAVAALCGFARLAADADRNTIYTLLWAFIAAYLTLVVLLELIFCLTEKVSRREMTDNLRPGFGSGNLDFILTLRQPVLICDENAKIIWYNQPLSDLVEKPSRLYGMPFESLTGMSLRAVCDNGSDGTSITLGKSEFLLHVSDLSVRNHKFLVAVFEDRTELETLRREIQDATAMVAYIIIDNIDELTQYAQSRTRSAENEVEAELEKWAASLDGVLKEYDKEKFLLLFNRKHMRDLEENKFDILDRIREIRVGDGSLPMTISIGISKAEESLSKRAAASAKCLDMALQRGGDQVVIRNEDGTLDFYGGKTKTVQKRTRVRARMMALNLLSKISESSDILIMMHRFPDFDAIGSAFGIMRLSCFCGVPAHIIVNKADPNFRRCFEHVKHLPDYSDESLFVSATEAQNLIGPDTLLVIVDVNNRDEFEAPDVASILPGKRTVVIDHHRKTAEFEEKPIIEYIEPSASSSCELITEMIEQTMQPGILQKEESDIMYAGITLDTKQFVRNTGVRTFSAALFLRGEGAIPSDAQALFKTDIADFLSEAQYETGVTLYREHFALAISQADGSDSGVRLAASKAADKLLSVKGIRASFALCRIGEGIRISARSDGEVNVQRIMEMLGGGGHFDASATFLPNTEMDSAIQKLKEAIDKQLNL